MKAARVGRWRWGMPLASAEGRGTYKGPPSPVRAVTGEDQTYRNLVLEFISSSRDCPKGSRGFSCAVMPCRRVCPETMASAPDVHLEPTAESFLAVDARTGVSLGRAGSREKGGIGVQPNQSPIRGWACQQPLPPG